LILDPPPRELQELIERRRKLGQDLFDEVWEGVLHMNPAPGLAHGRLESQLIELMAPLARAAGLIISGQFNLGESADDYRVPDLGLHRPDASGVWLPTAEFVVEIVSPGDETWQKLPFYAAHRVDEVVIVDPGESEVHWLALTERNYQEVQRSSVIELSARELAERIDWP
jgi:Uma2 family endonuclease